MYLAAFGAGMKSRKVRELLERYSAHRVISYVEDEDFFKIGPGGGKEELPITSIYSIGKSYKKGEIDGVVITTEYHKRTVEDMILSCEKAAGIKAQDIYLVPINVLRMDDPSQKELIVPYRQLAQIYNVNIHLTDHCNLNCELCCHSAPYAEQEVFAQLEECRKDFGRLAQLVPDVVNIALVGGEPFLHPQLAGFCQAAREQYPYASISVVTNGILLFQSPEALLDVMRENHILVDVSLYPPMHERLEEYLLFFRREHLAGRINRVDRFFKKFCDGAYYDGAEQSAWCGYCMGMEHGRMSRCIDSFYVKYLNKKFSLHLPEEAGIDIYEEGMTGLRLVHELEQPLKLCAWCANKYTGTDTYVWRQAGADVKAEDVLYRTAKEQD